jgi:hypothetical protein
VEDSLSEFRFNVFFFFLTIYIINIKRAERKFRGLVKEKNRYNKNWKLSKDSKDTRAIFTKNFSVLESF